MKNQTNKKPNPKKTQTGPSSLLIWASIILFIIASFAFLPDESANEVEVSYNTYKELHLGGNLSTKTTKWIEEKFTTQGFKIINIFRPKW